MSPRAPRYVPPPPPTPPKTPEPQPPAEPPLDPWSWLDKRRKTLTVERVASILEMDRDKVLEIPEADLPRYPITPQRIRFSGPELAAFMRSRRRGGRPQHAAALASFIMDLTSEPFPLSTIDLASMFDLAPAEVSSVVPHVEGGTVMGIDVARWMLEIRRGRPINEEAERAG